MYYRIFRLRAELGHPGLVHADTGLGLLEVAFGPAA